METLYASFRVFLGLTAKQATFSFPQVGRKCNTNYKKNVLHSLKERQGRGTSPVRNYMVLLKFLIKMINLITLKVSYQINTS